jgi:8-oxo-dGTP diphosphatase
MAVMRVVAAVIVRTGPAGTRVLVAQRPAHKREGLSWELPGGKVEPGEADAEALAREIREELGVDVLVGAELGVNVFAYSHGTIELVALRCTVLAGEPQALEHAALDWITAAELDTIAWSPADVGLVAAVRLALHPG